MNRVRFLYDLGFFIFALVYLPVFFVKGKFSRGFAERFGRVPAAAREKLAGRRTIWLHAVSVGEAALASRLASRLKEKNPGLAVLLTTTTATGRETAERLAAADAVLYFPLDFRGAVRAFLETVRPIAAVMMETEIWPNVLWELRARRIPAFIVNGRLSDRAIVPYRRFRKWVAPVLRLFDGIGAQDERMRARFVGIGADAAKVRATGNLKFDATAPELSPSTKALCERSREKAGLLWIAGSTHEGEEAIVFEVQARLAAKFPELRLLVAPRHPDRLASVEKAAREFGLTTQRLSSVAAGGPATDGRTAYLLDQMGVLASLYRAADAVFVGGSLVPVGGHNLVEPALFEKPVLFGPHMMNFSEMAAEFKNAGAAIQVADGADLERRLSEVLKDPGLKSRLGRAAREVVARHEGALQRNIETFLTPLGVL